MSDFVAPHHDDFVVARHDDRFGGFEELEHKDESFAQSTTNVKFFRKAIMPDDHENFAKAMEMQQHLLKDKTFTIVYPVYSTPDGRNWILISVLDEPTADAA